VNREVLVQKIKRKAKQDASKRRDPRFLETMGFLVAKGFLRTNLNTPLIPNKRLRIDDAIWAGVNVEPRILEVLPAAVLRLPRHFDLDSNRHPVLAQVVDHLRRGENHGLDFCGTPYDRIKVWANFPLRDRRVKPASKKKRIKTFRLDPTVIQHLKEIANARGCTETEIVEALILGLRRDK